MNIANTINCAKEKLCCLIDEAGQDIRIERLGTETFDPNSIIPVRPVDQVINARALVQKTNPQKDLIGQNNNGGGHENVEHRIEVFICPDDTDSFEKDDRLFYRNEEYEVEGVEVYDPNDTIVYYKLWCIKIEDD